MQGGNMTDTNILGQNGMEALKRGDAKTAREMFEKILALGDRDVSVLIAVSAARKAMGDYKAAHQSLDEIFTSDPENLQAYLMKADCFEAQGELRTALHWYNTVVKLAPPPESLPPAVADEIRRAQAVHDRLSGQMFAHIETALEAAGYDRAQSSDRFTQSLDFLTGKKKRYVQQPRAYYFPDLPDTEFYPRDAFDWLQRLEAATDEIASELNDVLGDSGAFAPYIHAEDNRPVRNDHTLLDNDAWSALFLWRDGRPVSENLARFPKTAALLEGMPLEDVPNKAPMALFSKLEPGARIDPHSGFLNSRLICHLPVIAPPRCYLRVGNETREWKRGEAWVFNDTIEHEAWNESEQSRVVLIFSIWRPELSAEERRLVSALLQSVDKAG